MRRLAAMVLVSTAVIGVPVAVWGQTLPPLASPVLPPTLTPAAPIGTLDGGHPLLTFSGAVGDPTPLPVVGSPAPLVCGVGCQEFTFTAATGGAAFLVAVKNTVVGPGGAFNANDGFDLFLYGPSGTLVDAKNGIGANGQALSVTAPAPGRYTIVVSYTYVEDPNAAYDGEVRLEAGATWSPAACTEQTVGSTTDCFLLPRLQAVPAYDLAVGGLPPVASTPLGFPFPVALSTPTSCYLDESLGLDNPTLSGIEHPIRRCLRFTSDIQNAGAGALQVDLPWLAAGPGGATSGFVPGQCQADQVLLTSSGTQVEHPAGACEFHPAHAHFHYKDLVSFSLYADQSGQPVGSPVATSLKESFCLSDDDYFGYGTTAPNGPRSFVGQPGCNVPSQISASGLNVTEGISPGWGDVYTWDTPDQFIDISTVPAGTYDLVEETNPDGMLLVAGPTQTCAVTQLQLTATGVTEGTTTPNAMCPA